MTTKTLFALTINLTIESDRLGRESVVVEPYVREALDELTHLRAFRAGRRGRLVSHGYDFDSVRVHVDVDYVNEPAVASGRAVEQPGSSSAS